MDDSKSMVQEAIKKIDNTTFLMNQYSVLNDAKVLIIMLNNIFDSLQKSIYALLIYERMWKRISVLPKDFKSQVQIFKQKCLAKYEIQGDQYEMIQELTGIINKHKNSEIEFRKQGEIFILEQDHKITKITPLKVKKYLENTKLIVNRIKTIIEK